MRKDYNQVYSDKLSGEPVRNDTCAFAKATKPRTTTNQKTVSMTIKTIINHRFQKQMQQLSQSPTTQSTKCSYKDVSAVNCPTSLDNVPVKPRPKRSLRHYRLKKIAKMMREIKNTHIRITSPSEQIMCPPIHSSLIANRGQSFVEHP